MNRFSAESGLTSAAQYLSRFGYAFNREQNELSYLNITGRVVR